MKMFLNIKIKYDIIFYVPNIKRDIKMNLILMMLEELKNGKKGKRKKQYRNV